MAAAGRESMVNPPHVRSDAQGDHPRHARHGWRDLEAVGGWARDGILPAMTKVVVPIAAGDAASLSNLAEAAKSAGADYVEVRLDTCAKRQAPLPERA